MAMKKEWNKPAVASQTGFTIGCGGIYTDKEGQYRHPAGEKDKVFKAETGPEITKKAENCICIREDNGEVRYKTEKEENIK